MKNFKILKTRLIKILIKILISFLILVFLFKLINIQNKNIKKQKELEEYEKKVSDKIKENEKIKQEIEKGMSDEYKEQYAREELNMAKAGERIIFDVTKE